MLSAILGEVVVKRAMVSDVMPLDLEHQREVVVRETLAALTTKLATVAADSDIDGSLDMQVTHPLMLISPPKRYTETGMKHPSGKQLGLRRGHISTKPREQDTWKTRHPGASRRRLVTDCH